MRRNKSQPAQRVYQMKQRIKEWLGIKSLDNIYERLWKLENPPFKKGDIFQDGEIVVKITEVYTHKRNIQRRQYYYEYQVIQNCDIINFYSHEEIRLMKRI